MRVPDTLAERWKSTASSPRLPPCKVDVAVLLNDRTAAAAHSARGLQATSQAQSLGLVQSESYVCCAVAAFGRAARQVDTSQVLSIACSSCRRGRAGRRCGSRAPNLNRRSWSAMCACSTPTSRSTRPRRWTAGW